MRTLLKVLTTCFLVSPLMSFGQGTTSDPVQTSDVPSIASILRESPEAISTADLTLAPVSSPSDDPAEPDSPQDPQGRVATIPRPTTPAARTYMFPSNSELNRFWLRTVAGWRPLIGGGAFH